MMQEVAVKLNIDTSKLDKIMKKLKGKMFWLKLKIWFLKPRWTKWELINIYNFNIIMRSVEVRQNLINGKVQFRTRKIVNPAHSTYFNIEDVKNALKNVL